LGIKEKEDKSFIIVNKEDEQREQAFDARALHECKLNKLIEPIVYKPHGDNTRPYQIETCVWLGWFPTWDDACDALFKYYYGEHDSEPDGEPCETNEINEDACDESPRVCNHGSQSQLLPPPIIVDSEDCSGPCRQCLREQAAREKARIRKQILIVREKSGDTLDLDGYSSTDSIDSGTEY
jgi:hypothetical protein